VVGLKRRLKRLEEVGEWEETRLSREALRHLSDEDLEALEDALVEAGQENGSATFEDLNSVLTARCDENGLHGIMER
jgi:hypothetical protein